jgi:gluconate 5-dehydrogenase
MNAFDPIFDISNKTIIVTGASSGLGASFSEILAERGANVVITARRLDRLNKLEQKLTNKGLSVLSIPCDVTKSTDVAKMIAKTEHEFGSLDVMINNAGLSADESSVPENMTDDMFSETIDVNLKGLWYCCREAGQRMLKNGNGSIINISSVAGLKGMRGVPTAYQTTKGAVVTLTQSLAANWADRGVRVNAIAPGWFKSELTMGLLRNKVFKERLNSNSPMGRIGKIQELYGVLLLLSSDASSFITGETISVDGGISGSIGMPFWTDEMFELKERAFPEGTATRIQRVTK